MAENESFCKKDSYNNQIFECSKINVTTMPIQNHVDNTWEISKSYCIGSSNLSAFHWTKKRSSSPERPQHDNCIDETTEKNSELFKDRYKNKRRCSNCLPLLQLEKIFEFPDQIKGNPIPKLKIANESKTFKSLSPTKQMNFMKPTEIQPSMEILRPILRPYSNGVSQFYIQSTTLQSDIDSIASDSLFKQSSHIQSIKSTSPNRIQSFN